MLETLVLFGHLAVAGLIIGLVLLQRGKGAEAGSGFGAGASGTVFGSRGSASFFSRATAVLATLFFATSLALAYFATQSAGPVNLLDDSVAADPDGNTEPGGAGVQSPPDESPLESTGPVPSVGDPGTVPSEPGSGATPEVPAIPADAGSELPGGDGEAGADADSAAGEQGSTG